MKNVEEVVVMLAKNKSGWKLMEYIDTKEDNIDQYQNVTGAYAILRIANKYVVGYNRWRKQWEFPAGGIDEGETAREAAIRELEEETHQKNEMLEFRGLFKVEDPKGIRNGSYGDLRDFCVCELWKERFSSVINSHYDKIRCANILCAP